MKYKLVDKSRRRNLFSDGNERRPDGRRGGGVQEKGFPLPSRKFLVI